MSWGAIGGAVGGALVSSALTKDSRDAASEANRSQAYAANTQADISAERWERYKEIYAPLENQMVEDVQALPSPDHQGAADKATADVTRAYTKARGMLGRDMARMGVNPASGAGMNRLQEGGVNMANSIVSARNAARSQEDQRALTNLQAKGGVASMGKGLPGSAMSGLSQSANIQGNLANQANQQTAGTANFVGNMTARVMDNWGNGGGGSGTPTTYTPYQGSTQQGGQNFNSMEFDDISAFSTQFADGGEIHGPGDGTSDSINGVVESPDGRVMQAQFSDGEYVIPDDVVRKKGTEFFDKLIEKHHTPVQRGMPMMGRGG